MPLELEPVGNDDFERILAEAKARIPVHVPEWTHFNESDPGISLVQLFAFMAESLLYRANRIPERNRRAFLRLLRIGLRPATPAEGFVTFRAKQAPDAPIEAGQRLQAGKVPFRTTTAVTVHPVEFHILHKAPVTLSDEERADWSAAFEGFRETDADRLTFYETRAFPEPEKGKPLPRVDLSTDAVDRSIWIALLALPSPGGAPREAVKEARQALAGKTLTVAVGPVRPEEAVLPPGGSDRPELLRETEEEEGPAEAIWEVLDSVDTTGTVPRATYRELTVQAGSDDVLREAGVVHLTLPSAEGLRSVEIEEPNEEGTGNLPPRLEEDAVRERVVAWIRLRVPSRGSAASLHWVAANAARVRQAVVVEGESVGVGSGEPEQVMRLANTPVLEDTLELRLRAPDGSWETWTEVQDLVGHARDARVYLLDREAGEIRFGDGLEGRRPERGRPVRADYEWGGGSFGNVPSGAIAKGSSLPPGLKLTNPLPTRGGAEGETVEDAEARIPHFLRHRERVVTREDFEDVLDRAPGIRLGRRDVLAAHHPTLGDGTPGAVTLLVVPAEDELNPDAPRPDAFFLRRICRWMEPRRLVTTEVHVRGPCYVPVWVSVAIRVRLGFARDSVLLAVKKALRDYLSPVTGGPDGTGWPLVKAVVAKDLEARATRVDGVEFVEQLVVAGPHARGISSLEMRGLELPEVRRIAVVEGAQPEPIDVVVGSVPTPDDETLTNVVHVPVVPESCSWT